MRDLFSKLMTASVVAGALLVSACGGESATENTATTDLNAMEPLDGTMNDVTAIDAMNGADANLAIDMNATDMNTVDMNAVDADMNATTNGM